MLEEFGRTANVYMFYLKRIGYFKKKTVNDV